jgi:hypothetical protein
MTENNKSDKEQESGEGIFLTGKGRHFMREELYLKRLSEQERKAYEECMALVQTLGQNGSHEEVCEWLERYTLDEKSE